MTRTLLIIDPRCLLIDAEADTAGYDIFEQLIIDAAGGWTGDAPVCRRGLDDWRQRLLTLLGIVRADVIGVVSIAAEYPSYASAAKILAYSPAKPAVKAPLAVNYDTTYELSIAIEKVTQECESGFSSEVEAEAKSDDEAEEAGIEAKSDDAVAADEGNFAVVIVTGQRDAEYLDALRSEVAWRTSRAPLVVNAGRLGLLEREFITLADALGVPHPQNRA